MRCNSHARKGHCDPLRACIIYQFFSIATADTLAISLSAGTWFGKTVEDAGYYMLDEATKIIIAILKYHTTNGKTIEVPEYQLKWSTFEK